MGAGTSKWGWLGLNATRRDCPRAGMNPSGRSTARCGSAGRPREAEPHGGAPPLGSGQMWRPQSNPGQMLRRRRGRRVGRMGALPGGRAGVCRHLARRVLGEAADDVGVAELEERREVREAPHGEEVEEDDPQHHGLDQRRPASRPSRSRRRCGRREPSLGAKAARQGTAGWGGAPQSAACGTQHSQRAGRRRRPAGRVPAQAWNKSAPKTKKSGTP